MNQPTMASGVCGEGRELKSQTLQSTLRLIIEVRDRLQTLKVKVGSTDRPVEAKVSDRGDVDPSSLVQVISNLRGDVQVVCEDALHLIDELEEDLL